MTAGLLQTFAALLEMFEGLIFLVILGLPLILIGITWELCIIYLNFLYKKLIKA